MGLSLRPLYERYVLRPLENWLRTKKNPIASFLVFEVGKCGSARVI